MLDTLTEEGRIIDAAMRLAQAKDWDEIALIDIAREAGLTLADLGKHFPTKAHVLAGFTKAADAEVMRRSASQLAREEGPRDRLFDVIMTRLDVLGPYKPALKRIMGSGPQAIVLPQALAFLKSQRWMLEAAGISTERPGAGLRIGGLALAYADVMRTWLSDDDPGHARTMAVLDRRLRGGERAIGTIDDICGGFGRMAKAVCGLGRRRREADANGKSPPSQPMGGTTAEPVPH